MQTRALIGIIALTAIAGCMTTQERFDNAVAANTDAVRRNITGKANAGKFYTKYSTLTDTEIVKNAGYTPEADEMEKLRKAVEAATRQAEREIAWKKWIESIKSKAGSAADAFVAKRDWENAREAMWRASTTTVPEVDSKVREWAYEYMNTKINPPNWSEIEKDLVSRQAKGVKAGKFHETVTMLAKYPRIRTFSSVLDGKLQDVKAELVTLGVDAGKIDPAMRENLAKVGTVENIIDLRDTTTNLVTNVDGRPDLDEFNRKLEEYRKTLVRFNATDPKSEEVKTDFRERVQEYIDALDKSTSNNKPFLFLGSSAVNARTDELVKALREDCFKVWIESLKAEVAKLISANKFDEVRKLLEDVKKFGHAELEATIAEAEAANAEAEQKYNEAKSKKELDDAVAALKKEVVELVREGKFEEARNTIRDVELKMVPVWDATMYVTRVNLLDSIVNPRQLTALQDAIDAKIKELKEAEDYEGIEEYVKNYPYVHDTYEAIAEGIVKIKDAMVGLEFKEEEATDYTDKFAAYITAILESRNEGGNLNESNVDLHADLMAFEAAYNAQYFKGAEVHATSKMVENDIRAMLARRFCPITTAELNAQLALRLEQGLKNLNELKAKRDARIASEKYAELLKTIEAEISLDQQIAVIEETICLRKGCDFNATLGNAARILRLMKKGDEVSADDATTLLLAAVSVNLPELAKKSFELGAEINGVSARDPRKRTALLVAIESGNLGFLDTLNEKGALQTALDAEGNTAIHYAAKRGTINLVKVLAEVVDVKAVNARGETALFAAARRNQPAVASALIELVGEEERKAYVEIGNDIGLTALSVAGMSGSVEVMDALVAAGAKINNAMLVDAALNDRLAVAKWLVAQGADVNGENVMAAAFGNPENEHDTETYKFLVSEGGVALERVHKCPEVKVPATNTTINIDCN